MITRAKARDWLITVALGALGWVFVWSAGIVFNGPNALYATARALGDEVRLARESDQARAELSKTLSSVEEHANQRMRSAEAIFDRHASRAHYDSIASRARDERHEAGDDSVAVSATRVLSLPRGYVEVVAAAERATGAERAWWRRVALWSEARRQGRREERESNDTSIEAQLDAMRTAYQGYALAMGRSYAVWRQQDEQMESLTDRRNSEYALAKRKFLAAFVGLYASIVGLFWLLLFARAKVPDDAIASSQAPESEVRNP